VEASTQQIFCLVVFALAVLHTFSTGIFERLAHAQPNHAGLWHFFGEVEAVFGIWALVLVLGLVGFNGMHDAVAYVDGQNFTEPMFVFAIMVIAASRPILLSTKQVVQALVKLIPVNRAMGLYFLTLSAVPLLGSFITEPAAMTLAALMLRDSFFVRPLSSKLKYATIGALFVNVSIGGTLTPFAAPPVLMVAGTWGWDMAFMVNTFGWKSAVAVLVNALIVTLMFGKELSGVHFGSRDESQSVPMSVSLMHLLFLIGVVVFSHHPAVFMGIFLFFLGYAKAYERHQDRLIIREGLMVAFFLAGLVVLGGQQQWWLNDVLTSLSPTALYYGATALTAITDNAALTYLGSLVPNVSDAFKYSLVAGAVTGGGLTVIANAPNPAGVAILKAYFPDETVAPGSLFLAAAGPTVVAILAFQLL
jgi:hypothetical protein